MTRCSQHNAMWQIVFTILQSHDIYARFH